MENKIRNIIVFGAGKYGKLLRRILESKFLDVEENRFKVQYFCDNYKISGSFVDGIKVIRPLDIIKSDLSYAIFISSMSISDEVMKQLFELNIKNDVFIIPEYVYSFRGNGKEMPFCVKMDISKPRLPYLECAIVGHCNLNCKGCSAIANIRKEQYVSVKEFEKDLIGLKRLYSGIKYFKLLGGEPLLHPDLTEFLKMARGYFPDAELVVHSNGLLVPEMEEKTLKLMSEYAVKFIFTQYPVTGTKKRKIIQRLEQMDVTYEFMEPVYEFRKFINMKGDYNPKEIYKQCCKCINLVEGTLSCGVGYSIEKLEEAYGINICEDKFQNCIYIHKTDMNGWEINKRLDSPSNLCAYCAFMDIFTLDDDNFYPWKCGHPQLDDWIID